MRRPRSGKGRRRRQSGERAGPRKRSRWVRAEWSPPLGMSSWQTPLPAPRPQLSLPSRAALAPSPHASAPARPRAAVHLCPSPPLSPPTTLPGPAPGPRPRRLCSSAAAALGSRLPRPRPCPARPRFPSGGRSSRMHRSSCGGRTRFCLGAPGPHCTRRPFRSLPGSGKRYKRGLWWVSAQGAKGENRGAP